MNNVRKKIVSVVLLAMMFIMTFSNIDAKAVIIYSTKIQSIMTDVGIVVDSSEVDTKVINVYRHTYTVMSAKLITPNANENITWKSSNEGILKVVGSLNGMSAKFIGLTEGYVAVTATTSDGDSLEFKVRVLNIEDSKGGSTIENPQAFPTEDTITDSLLEVKKYYREGKDYTIKGNKLSSIADRDYFSLRILSDSTLTVTLRMPNEVEYVLDVLPYVMCMNEVYNEKLSPINVISRDNEDGTKTATYKFKTNHYVNFLNQDLEVSNFVITVKNKDGRGNVSNLSYNINVKYEYPGSITASNGGIWKTNAILDNSTTNTNKNYSTGIDAVHATYNLQSDINSGAETSFYRAYNTKWYLTPEQVEQWKVICDFLYGEEMLNKVKSQLNNDKEALFEDTVKSYLADYASRGLKLPFSDSSEYIADYLYGYVTGSISEESEILKCFSDDVVADYLENDPLAFISLLEKTLEEASESGNLSQTLKDISECIEYSNVEENFDEIIKTMFKDNFIKNTYLGLISNAIYTAIGTISPGVSLILPIVVDGIGYYRKEYNVNSWIASAKTIMDYQSRTTLNNEPISVNALTARYLSKEVSKRGGLIYKTWNGSTIEVTQNYDLIGNVTQLNNVTDNSSSYPNYISSITSVSNAVVRNKFIDKQVSKSYKPKETFEISGWSMHTQGVMNYFYAIDNSNATRGTFLTGKIDSTVLSRYPAYSKQCRSLNAFSGSLSLSDLSPGEHYIYVKATTKANTIYTVGIIKINIQNITKGTYINTIDGINSISNSDEFVVTHYTRLRNAEKPLTIPLNGWSVNSDGISYYYYTIDNESKTTGTKLKSSYREDVANAYPSYSNICSDINSFTGEVNVSNFAPGGHSIYIKGVDKYNRHYTIAKLVVNITTAPDEGEYINKLKNLPSVYCDVAKNLISREYKSTTPITLDGWSINSQGVEGYYYTIDEASSKDSSNKLEMSYSKAVAQEYSGYDRNCKDGNSFKGSADISKLSPGRHYIYIKGITKEGAHYNVAKLAIDITTNYNNKLESPNSNITTNRETYATVTRGYNSSLPVKIDGWSLHDDGIRSFYYTIDDESKTTGTALLPKYRRDILVQYPEYMLCCNIINAFSGEINVGNITMGSHSIYIKGVTNTGVNYVIAKITVNIVAPSVGKYKNTIDNPKGSYEGANGVVESTVYRTYQSTKEVSIGGWSLNTQGISHYYYTIDNENKMSGEILTSTYRQDVIDVYPDFKNACYDKNAFSGKVDISNLAPSVHTIYVKAVNKEEQHYTVAKIKVDIRSAGHYNNYIDTFKVAGNNTVATASTETVVNINNIINLQGWAVHSDGIQSFYYTVGDENSSTRYGLTSYFRSDVDKANLPYNQVCNSINAYKGEFNTKNIGRGGNLYIRAITKTGKHVTLGKISIYGRDAQVGHYVNFIDTPVRTGGTDEFAYLNINKNLGSKDPVYVAGWSVNTQGIKRYYYTIDDSYSITGTNLNDCFRQDVANANPQYASVCSDRNAFSGNIDISGLGQGTHYIYIKAENKEGVSYVVAKIAVYITKIPSIGTYVSNVDYTNGYKHSKGADNDAVEVSSGLNYGYGQQYTINGWSVNSHGISGFYSEIDGGTLTAINSYYREDIANAYPAFNKGNINSYSCTLNLSQLSRGQHVVRIYADNRDGYRYLVAKINVNIY